MSDGTLQLGSAPANGAEDVAGSATAAVGALLDGRYRLDRVLGEGGMGVVYEAENVRIGRKVAVKVLHPEFARSQVDVERFRREAQIAGRLGSPHVVEVLDFGCTAGGELFLVMELLQGESVADRLARTGRFSPERVAELLRQLLAGLSAAHAAGIVHRDLKPENLWFAPDGDGGERLKILDFGIAKVADMPEGAARTQAGVVVGTPEYVSPEQAVGGAIDARSDLYSVGIIAWVLSTGRHPFPRSDPREVLRAHAFEPVPPPDRDVPELSAHAPLLRFVARATEKTPSARAQSAAELLAILDGREARLRSTPPAGPRAPSGAGPAAARSLSGLLRPTAALPRVRGETLLVTELAGYAELEARLPPDDLARLLLVHDEVVLPAIRAFHGRRVRASRETVLAAFPSPTNAVLCGVAMQDRLAARRDLAGPAAALALRVGIHTGESRPSGGDRVGGAVDVALAVRGAAEPGDVALSRTVYLAMNRSEVAVEPRPAIAEPQRDERLPVYRVSRVAGPLPYGGREAERVAASARVTRALAPVADGIASIEDGAAEGRLRATVRVLAATGALASLACADGCARVASGALGAAAWLGWRGRPAPAGVERLSRRLEGARAWVRTRRPIQRVALGRPLR